jgi:ABC-type multidrug transport system ATPase subunit
MNMSTLVAVNHLTKQFPGLTAVDDLSFTVMKGDVYGFLGQNGAGKSTTLRMLLTLIRPTSGDIQLFGKALTTHRSVILRQIGAVIEKPDLYKYLTAWQNLTLFARMSGLRPDKRLLMDQLELVGLADRAHDKVKNYSQGMKQRLGIAVALVHQPALVILDEPTNGLDPQGIAEMRQLILRLSAEMGKTIIVSSHLLSEIEQMANRMLIINKGKKVVEGRVAELLDPAHTLVQINTTERDAALRVLGQSRWAAQVQPDTPQLRVALHSDEVPALTACLVQAGIPISGMVPQHSLEDYFLSLTTTPARHVDTVTT